MGRINVPTIGLDASDQDRLVQLWRSAIAMDDELVLDFGRCEALTPYALAFIGGLGAWMRQRDVGVKVDLKAIDGQLERYLRRSRLLQSFGYAESIWRGRLIPYRHDLTLRKNDLVRYLRSMLVPPYFYRTRPEYRDFVVSTLWELYDNAFEHSLSSIGVFSCGEHLIEQEKVLLSVVDFGVGIPDNVRLFLGKPGLTSDLAMNWAFLRGKTTSPIDAERGLGLVTLKDFIMSQEGELEVFSHDGYARITPESEVFMARRDYFEGTIINVTFSLVTI